MPVLGGLRSAQCHSAPMGAQQLTWGTGTPEDDHKGRGAAALLSSFGSLCVTLVTLLSTSGHGSDDENRNPLCCFQPKTETCLRGDMRAGTAHYSKGSAALDIDIHHLA